MPYFIEANGFFPNRSGQSHLALVFSSKRPRLCDNSIFSLSYPARLHQMSCSWIRLEFVLVRVIFPSDCFGVQWALRLPIFEVFSE